MTDHGEQQPSGAGRLMSWIGALSAIITIVLTVLNAYWSNEARLAETEVKKVETEIRERQVQLEAERDRLSRYAFVQDMLGDVLDEDKSQRSLTVNLIRLALTEGEAEQLFAGLESSDNEEIQEFGRAGLSAIQVSDLVMRINDAIRQNRLDAVQTLIEEHKDNPSAVDQALSMLKSPAIDNLSASGRINVLVFLRNTTPGAWNQQQLIQGREAIQEMRERDAQGIARIGPQTRDAIQRFQSHLNTIEATF